MNYYRLLSDVEKIDRWFLKGPTAFSGQTVDADMFSTGKRADDVDLLRYSIRSTGSPLDITFADFDVIIARRDISELLHFMSPSGTQIIRAQVETKEGWNDNYAVVNIVDVVKCLDESRSQVMWWNPSDGRPDKIGSYRMVTGMIINPQLAKGHKIFRLAGWETAVIIDETVKDMLQKQQVSGVRYELISR